ncbi:MAG: glycosyltransferase [Bacteroidetes bacterium]|nr:glycosyltransferase [Bacteroidota bacterium]
MIKQFDYALITPARNEEAYIGKTIQSIISQTIVPKKWIIVSDGSTDRTEEIVKKYASVYNFIHMVKTNADADRNFSSKVKAIKTGVEKLNNTKYQFIGNLDADISFEPHYYESIIKKFHQNDKLGIAGGIINDMVDVENIRRLVSTSWSVSGGIQLFRRQCYDDIGGHFPLKRGGEDAIAEVMARMHGWEVKTYPDIKVLHHRRTGTAQENILLSKFNLGLRDYSIGYHPLFEVSRCMWRMMEKPYILGSSLRICGFIWAFLQREKRALPGDIIRYLRREQLKRLSSTFSNGIN